MENIPIADHEAAVAEARTAATIAERERIGTILQSDAAKDRPAAALKLALTADVAPNLADTILGTIAAEPTAAATPTVSSIYGQRSQDAQGGLVIDGAPQMSSDPQAPKTEFEAGREIGKRHRQKGGLVNRSPDEL